MLTLEQCKKLKEWGMDVQLPRKVYLDGVNGYTTGKIPTLTELLEFAVEVAGNYACDAKGVDSKPDINLIYNSHQKKWGCRCLCLNGHLFYNVPDESVYKLIEKIMEA